MSDLVPAPSPRRCCRVARPARRPRPGRVDRAARGRLRDPFTRDPASTSRIRVVAGSSASSRLSRPDTSMKRIRLPCQVDNMVKKCYTWVFFIKTIEKARCLDLWLLFIHVSSISVEESHDADGGKNRRVAARVRRVPSGRRTPRVPGAPAARQRGGERPSQPGAAARPGLASFPRSGIAGGDRVRLSWALPVPSAPRPHAISKTA